MSETIKEKLRENPALAQQYPREYALLLMDEVIEDKLKDNTLAAYYAREYAILLQKYQELEKKLQEKE